MADPQVLPAPLTVARLMWAEARSGELAAHVGATLVRVALVFAVAMVLGTALGLAMGRHPRLDRWLDAWLVFLLNVPALVVIVLAYLWIGLNETAAIVAVCVNKVPMVAVTMREGTRALDPALDEMAAVFPFAAPGPLAGPRRRWAVWRHVVAPQLAPFFATAARNGLATIWKIVLIVEFLGRSSGVGFQVHLYFQLFDVAHVLVYALAFTGIMLAIEYGALQPWERRAARWRDTG